MNTMVKKRVIGIGETVLDILFKDNQPLKAVPGGSTLNSIVSLGRAGVACAMVTEVGCDLIGDITCRFMKENGVSLEYVCRHPNVKSNISLAFLDENNEAQYLFYKDHESASMNVKLPLMREDDIVLFGSYFAINPAHRPVVGKLLHQAHKAGAWLYYDVNFRKNHIGDLPEVMPNIVENMDLADVVRGSVEDFYNIYQLNEGDDIYARVSPHCRILILTNGSEPVRVYTPTECQTYPVKSIKTISTVGAGDNFNAGYIYATMQGQNEQAARIAVAQQWSQDVCRQIGNNISNELVTLIKKGNSNPMV